MKNNLCDCIILGGGPAGMSGALYCSRAGLSCAIVDSSALGGAPTNYCEIENYLGFQRIDGVELCERFEEHINNFNVDKYPFEEIQSIVLSQDIKKVKTLDKELLSKTIIIATGAKSKKLGIKGEIENIGRGVSYCAVCDGAFYKDKDVYLIGDANTALQYALMLSAICANVYLFTLFDRFFADQILIDRLKQQTNIHITHNMNLIAYLGQNELAGLRFENTIDRTIHEFPTNNVFIAIGQVSQNDIFKSLVQTDEHGFIITNEKMETSLPGLFAIGDTRKKDVRQVASAIGDASVASVFIDKYIQFNSPLK